MKQRVTSKRGTMGSALGDNIVPHHSHGRGGVLNHSGGNGSERTTAGLANGRGVPRIPSGGATLEDIARRVRAQSDRWVSVCRRGRF